MSRRASLVVAVVALVSTADSGSAQPQGASSARDSAAIARERAVWAAVLRKDSAATVQALGNSPAIRLVTPGGIESTSAAELVKAVLGCETRRATMDSTRVDHVSETTVLVNYRLGLDRTCGKDVMPSSLYITSLWTRRGTQWQAVAQTAAEVGLRSATR